VRRPISAEDFLRDAKFDIVCSPYDSVWLEL